MLAQLPARQDSVIPVDLTPEQREAHDELTLPIARLARIARHRPLTQAEFLKLMSLLLMQRVIANGMAQLDFEATWPAIRNRRSTPKLIESLGAPKLLELRELVASLALTQKRKVEGSGGFREVLARLSDPAAANVASGDDDDRSEEVSGETADELGVAIAADAVPSATNIEPRVDIAAGRSGPAVGRDQWRRPPAGASTARRPDGLLVSQWGIDLGIQVVEPPLGHAAGSRHEKHGCQSFPALIPRRRRLHPHHHRRWPQRHSFRLRSRPSIRRPRARFSRSSFSIRRCCASVSSRRA